MYPIIGITVSIAEAGLSVMGVPIVRNVKNSSEKVILSDES